MAAAEARALLDQLMGGDRNAPLPKGAALPRSKKRRGNGVGESSSLLLPGKRHKSCYDADICPLFCSWGVDVYELFVNTKSDIGPNPYTPDEAARQEYLGLPQHERERLGFEHMLFVKLSELVQQCDRTVQRNHEKLNKELQRQLQKRGGQDYVQDVEEGAVEQLCRNQLLVEEMTQNLEEALKRLVEVKKRDDDLKKQMEQTQAKTKIVKQEDPKGGDSNNDADVTVEKDSEEAGLESEQTVGGEAMVKKEEVDTPVGDAAVKEEADTSTGRSEQPEPETETKTDPSEQRSSPEEPSAQSLELGKLTLEKQAIICDIARMLGRLGPLQESVETQSRNLNHVKSDITTDKTVCDVSGNFMSARDADERIAAHYAGKQYVGWKLVRDKFKEMVSKFGKYGPPPPGRGGPPGGPLQSQPLSRGGPPARGFDHRRGNFHGGDHFRGGGGGGGGGGGSRRGGGRGRRSPSPARWERGGGHDRGYDNRGGYDRGRRGSDNRGGGYRGGGGGGDGGWGRR